MPATSLLAQSAAGGKQIGIFRQGTFILDANGDGFYDAGDGVYSYGELPGDIPVVGDWNGSGSSEIGLFRPSTGQWILDANRDGVYDSGDAIYGYGGLPGDIPVAGDWNGSGTSKIGISRPSIGEWVLDYNGNGTFDAADNLLLRRPRRGRSRSR